MTDASWLLAIATTVVCAGVVLIPACWRGWRSLALVRAAMISLLALSFVLIGVLGLITASAIFAWNNLTWEQPVANIDIVKNEQHDWRLKLLLVESREHLEFDVSGDVWQLDARVLRWQARASALGMRPRYRLERLSTREQTPAQADREMDSFALGDEQIPVTIKWLSQAQSWLPWLDSIYGSAVYMPLSHGARFEVILSRSGLVARAANYEAQQSVVNWQ